MSFITGDAHESARARRSRAAHVELRGAEAAAQRAREIAALPTVIWKGRELRTVRCVGEGGKGPHDVNVPEHVLWQLIDLRRFVCPYHGHPPIEALR
jgi:hypothetical protein